MTLRDCVLSFLRFFLKIFVLILFLAALGLCHYGRAFSSCGEQASRCGASHVGFGSSGSQAYCSAGLWVFLDQGSNLCPLHRQVDS